MTQGVVLKMKEMHLIYRSYSTRHASGAVLVAAAGVLKSMYKAFIAHPALVQLNWNPPSVVVLRGSFGFYPSFGVA